MAEASWSLTPDVETPGRPRPQLAETLGALGPPAAQTPGGSVARVAEESEGLEWQVASPPS